MSDPTELETLREQVTDLKTQIERLELAPDVGDLVTDLDRAEMLREAERITNTGSWVFDMRANRVYWSDQLFTILGYDPDVDEATTENYYARVHPDDETYARQVGQKWLEEGMSRVDYRLLLPDGEVKWVSAEGAALYDEHGELRRMVGTVRDTTEERAAARALAEAHRLEAVGQLAGGVAHDFRNLLMVIRGEIDLLENVPAETQKAVDSAIEAASILTSQLLAFGQRASLRPQLTDLNDIARRTHEMLDPLLPADYRLALDLAEEPLVAQLDADLLSEALTNLVLAARDASSAGPGMRITTARRGAEVELRIHDGGSLIVSRDHVFEPFFHPEQGDSVDLRLAMAHGIVAQHGGRITLEDGNTEDPCFVIRFAGRDAPGEPEEIVRRSAGSRSILVVDDQAPVARVVSRLLESEGHVVVVAEHPRRAIEIFEERGGDFDLILTDLAMPEMLGTELIEHLAARFDLPAVIFMSGYAAVAAAQIDEGYMLLHKPFTRQELLDAISRVVLTVD